MVQAALRRKSFLGNFQDVVIIHVRYRSAESGLRITTHEVKSPANERSGKTMAWKLH